MTRTIRRTAAILNRTIAECMRDNTSLLAAGLSFYTLLSMAPALWLVTAAVGAIIGRESAHAQVIRWTTELAGERVALYVGMLADAVEASSPVASVLGGVSMFFGATLVFGALHDSLNRIWNAPSRSGWGLVRGYFLKRLLAFAVVLLCGALILASLLAQSALTAAAKFAPESLPVSNLVFQAADFLISMGLMLVLFAGIYGFLHNAAIAWHDVWVGASVTAFLFAVGKTLISIYLGKATLTSVHGAAGSLVVLLLWVYYSAQIFFFGAEFTEVYSKARKPRPHASERYD
jgi:membrane protein